MTNGAVNIKVFGVGGAGCNAITRLLESKIRKVKFYAVNTDIQDLSQVDTKNKIILGTLGAGANPAVGRQAAIEHIKDIEKAVKNTDLVYITCGMGGGTGTGAAPIIAKAAKEAGALTVAIVTKPFTFEGLKRTKQAEEGINELRKWTDSIIVVSNDKLLKLLGNVPITESFKESDNVLKRGVQAIINLILKPALINLDFADINYSIKNMGSAVIGIGVAEGEDRVRRATEMALNSPLIDVDLTTARKAILSVSGDKDISLFDINGAAQFLKEKSNSDIDVMFGASFENGLKNTAIVTTIITGITDHNLGKISNPENFEPKKEVVEEIEIPNMFKENEIIASKVIDADLTSTVKLNTKEIEDDKKEERKEVKKVKKKWDFFESLKDLIFEEE